MSQGKSYILSILFATAVLASWVTIGYGGDKVVFHLSWSGDLPRWLEIIALGVTVLGDGWVVVPLITAIAMLTRRSSDQRQVAFWVAIFIALLAPQIIKAMNPDTLRPWGALPLDVIPGLDIATMKSFPSGHTAAGVFAWGYVAMGLNRKWITVMCVILGIAVGWSRMALNMHWSWDVIVGALLAVLALAMIDRIKTD